MSLSGRRDGYGGLGWRGGAFFGGYRMLARWLFVTIALAAGCSTADLKPASVTPTSGDQPGGYGSDADASPDGGWEESDEPLAMSRRVTIQVLPSDEGQAVLSAISGAKKSVHMTMYLLTSRSIIDALGDQKDQGRDVKVILNKSFPSNKNENEKAFADLTKRGVSVVWAPKGYHFTHAKTVIIDSEKALIMTMNLTASSPTTNREYIATDTDPEDVADLEAVFASDFSDKAVHLPSKLVFSPAGANTVHTARAHIKRLIDSAKTSLDVEVQSISDETLVEAIVHAHEANVDVRVVVDAETLRTPAQKAAVDRLRQVGVPIRGVESPDMHAKAIVVDGERVFVGSHNLTPTALDQNREIGVIADVQAEATKVRQVILEDFAGGTEL